MFSWMDYFNTENNEILHNKSHAKVLKKSDLCKLINDSNCTRQASHTRYKSRINKTALNSEMKQIKILDLSPEEKEKIAALIRELGNLQSEKEKVSKELEDERLQFQCQLSSIEKMYKKTLEDKDKLSQELQKKIEALKNLKIEETKNSKIDNEKPYFNEDFVIVPKISLQNWEEYSNNSDKSGKYLPGPPKSSTSQRLTSDLLRSHSLLSVVNNNENSARHLLMKEQKDLLTEKHYLSVVLKQQKCLKKLTSKIKKLEKNSKIINNSETGSIFTDSVDLVTPRTLNNASFDESSVAQSLSATSQAHSPTVSVTKQQLPPSSKDNTQFVESSVLKNEDLLFITALNRGDGDNLPPFSTKAEPHHTFSRNETPSDSFFQIIDNLDGIHLRDYYNSDIDCAQYQVSETVSVCEEDILNDLFFNL